MQVNHLLDMGDHAESLPSPLSLMAESYLSGSSTLTTLPPAQVASTIADNRELRAQVEQLQAERNRLLETQSKIMALIGTRTPEKILHDIRNVLNERDLLKTLVDSL
jgi:hypothetical protein